jgi:4-carboxymuconolactone decarboxylase
LNQIYVPRYSAGRPNKIIANSHFTSLVTLGALIAVRATDELRFHMPIALRNGLTVEEIEEVVYHLTGYAGFPAANAARGIGREVLPPPQRDGV